MDQRLSNQLLSVFLRSAVPKFLAPGTDFVKDNFFHGLTWGGWWFGDDSTHYIYCALYFYYYYISSTSDHQVLDPRGWGPML